MKIRYCPKCKSTDVKINITASAVFGAPQKWRCMECGYESDSIFPEKEIQEKKKQIKNHGKANKRR